MLFSWCSAQEGSSKRVYESFPTNLRKFISANPDRK